MTTRELPKENACGCCEGVSIQSPIVLDNRPGLSAIAYRIGRHSEILASLQARLASADFPALARLRTRDSDDFTMALLDGFASMADVLTFYQERIANESYLRTATERLSLQELARLIGYRLRPGVAAETYLAFTLEKPPKLPKSVEPQEPKQYSGVPESLTLKAGIQVKSIPGPDEKPQTFETAESIQARPEWNALRPRLTREWLPSQRRTDCYLKGTNLNLKSGDGLLFLTKDDSGNVAWRQFSVIATADSSDTENNRTHVTWSGGLNSSPPPGLKPQVFVFRRKAAVYGHNAPMWKTMPQSFKEKYPPDASQPDAPDWPNFTISEVSNAVDLDSRYSDITNGSWLLLMAELPLSTPSSFKHVTAGHMSAHVINVKKVVAEQVTVDGKGFQGVTTKGTASSELSPQKLSASDVQLEGVEVDELTLKNVQMQGRTIASLQLEDVRSQSASASALSMTIESAEGISADVVSKRAASGTGMTATNVTAKKISAAVISASDFSLKQASATVVSVSVASGLFCVDGVNEVSLDTFGMSGKVTRVSLKHASDKGSSWAEFQDHVRETTVYAVSEELILVEAPDGNAISGNRVELESNVEGLARGRKVILAGRRKDNAKEQAEVLTIDSVEPVGVHTMLTFTEDVDGAGYERDSVTIYANVARATHGETVHQILGSGDGRAAHQRFLLQHAPLTFVGANNELGAEAALKATVNDIEWHGVPSLYGTEPNDRSYVLRVDEDGKGQIQFGDGKRGARLPTGRDNVRAKYRKGIGKSGNLKAGQLAQLITRPLGLKAVSNPLPSSGGTDADSNEHARRNMPLGVRTLGRVVSLQDYEDFARAYTGIAKAQAVVITTGGGRTVFITVAGEGRTVPTREPTLNNLTKALRRNGDPFVHFEVAGYRPGLFKLMLQVKVQPDIDAAKVQVKVTEALLKAFSFDARDFGQPVTRSEIYQVVQQVEGVVAVNIKEGDFYIDRPQNQKELPDNRGRLFPGEATGVQSAELLMLDAENLNVEPMP